MRLCIDRSGSPSSIRSVSQAEQERIEEVRAGNVPLRAVLELSRAERGPRRGPYGEGACSRCSAAYRLGHRVLADRCLAGADGGGANTGQRRPAARVGSASIAHRVQRAGGPLLDANGAGLAAEAGPARDTAAARADDCGPDSVLAPRPRPAAAVREVALGLGGLAHRTDAEAERRRAAADRYRANEPRLPITGVMRAIDDDVGAAPRKEQQGTTDNYGNDQRESCLTASSADTATVHEESEWLDHDSSIPRARRPEER